MKRILIVRFSSLGDVILTEPIARALKQHFADAHIDYLTKSLYVSLVQMFPSADDVKEWHGEHRFRETINLLREANYDLIVDLHNNLRSSRVRTAVPARSVKAGKDWLARFKAVHFKKLAAQPRSALERYADALAELGISAQLGPPVLSVPDSARLWWQGERRKISLENRYAIFAAGARYPTKQAPASVLLAVAEKLVGKGIRQFIVLGAPSESKSLGEFARVIADYREVDSVKVITPEEITRTAAVIESATAVISNDTGPAHLAAALGTPVVALFGPTHPILGFTPLGDNAAAYTINEFCSPCSRHGERTCYRDRRYCFLNMDAAEIVALLQLQIK